MDEIRNETSDNTFDKAMAPPANFDGSPEESPANFDMGGAPSQAPEAQESSDPSGQDNTRKRQEQALMFEKYLEESGLCLSFQIIFTEIIQKQIPEDQVFPYTAMRLRQIGKELESIDNKAQ